MKNGGSAFPTQQRLEADEQWNQTYDSGMTLRDYFADGAVRSGDCPHNVYDFLDCAEWAYKRADAMLAARETPPK